VRPIIYHIPHASTHIPADVRDDLLLDDEALAREVRILTDHFTDRMFEQLALPSDVVVACPVSRLVVDVERFADDVDEPMSARGMGAVYTRTHDQRQLRTSTQSREALMKRFYDPHHAALTRAVDQQLAQHGSALIIDCHSFPQHPLPYEQDQTLHRPEICIGTDAMHTRQDVAEAVEQVYRNYGFEVARNTPFAGAIVPLACYGRNPKVQSVMIEIRRDLYMDEATEELKSNWSQLAQANAAAVSGLRNVAL
jgi:N-formylglutamate deformylase